MKVMGIVEKIEKKHSKKGNDYWVYFLKGGESFSSFKSLPCVKGQVISVEVEEKNGFSRVVEPPKSVGKPSSAGEIGVSSGVEKQDLVEVGRFFSILEAVFDEAVGLAGVTSEDCCDIASTIYINAKQKERFQR